MKINAKRLLLPLFLIAIPFTYGLKKMSQFFYSLRRPSYGFFDDYYASRRGNRFARLLFSGLGGFGGAKGGAALGALIGTLAFPGIGTAVGIVVGAILGALLGMSLGNWSIRQIIRVDGILDGRHPVWGHPNHRKYQPDAQSQQRLAQYAQDQSHAVILILRFLSEKRRENKKKLSSWARVSFFFGSEEDKGILKEIEYLDYATGKVRNGDIVAVEQMARGVEMDTVRAIPLKTTYTVAKPRDAKEYQPMMRFTITKSWHPKMPDEWTELKVLSSATQPHRHDPLFRFSARK